MKPPTNSYYWAVWAENRRSMWPISCTVSHSRRGAIEAFDRAGGLPFSEAKRQGFSVRKTRLFPVATDSAERAQLQSWLTYTSFP